MPCLAWWECFSSSYPKTTMALLSVSNRTMFPVPLMDKADQQHEGNTTLQWYTF